jgi:hypothetical protein
MPKGLVPLKKEDLCLEQPFLSNLKYRKDVSTGQEEKSGVWVKGLDLTIPPLLSKVPY